MACLLLPFPGEPAPSGPADGMEIESRRMSGFLMAFGVRGTEEEKRHRVGALSRTLHRRGSGEAERHIDRDLLALGLRFPWEEELSPGPALFSDHRFVVVADAALYHLPELARQLDLPQRHIGRWPAARWIAAAWARWGIDAVHRIEGDWAFALRDRERGVLFAARDSFGTRPLFLRSAPGRIAFASAPETLLELEGGAEMDPVEMLRALLGRPGAGFGTIWSGVTELPAGWRTMFREESPGDLRSVLLDRHGLPKERREWRDLSPSDAALALRSALAEACEVRRGPTRTGATISGGRDSTSIVALLGGAGGEGRGGGGGALDLFSLRFPEGDPGHEESSVLKVADAVNLPVHWVPTTGVPVYDGVISDLGRRHHPEPVPFEGLFRALSAAAAAAGNRVLLHGSAADVIFSLPDGWIGRAFAEGRWREGWRGLRALESARLPVLWESALRPSIPMRLFDRLEVLRGRRIATRPWEMGPLLPWIRRDGADRAGIVETDREWYRTEVEARADGPTAQARLWAAIYARFGRLNAAVFEVGLRDGTETRVPFGDPRVTEIAWNRPPEELSSGGETKILLDRAMQGVLPDALLANRRFRTGTSDGYFWERLRIERDRIVAEAERPSPMHDARWFSPEEWRKAVADFRSGRKTHLTPPFLSTVAIGEWLRHRAEGGARMADEGIL